MTEEHIKAQAIADKVMMKANDVLSTLDRELTLRGWTPEFRSIMWCAIAQQAMRRSIECDKKTGGVK